MASKYRAGGWGFLVLLFLLLTGCGTGFQNETIIISGNETSEQIHQDLSPVQVKKIYRLPDENMDKGYWWGWSSTNAMVGAFKSPGYPERLMLKQLSYPFEQSENISEISMDNDRMTFSPDGTHVADIRTTRTVATLELFSIKDRKETAVDTFSSKGQMYFQSMSWSDNSQYISYLILDAAKSNINTLRIYDTTSKASNSYVLNEFNAGDTLLGVQVSNDGRSALIKLYASTQPGKITVVLGKLIDGHFESKYRREIADNKTNWIGNNQFAFLGRDGTLYEYDLRNGELSVILERVSAFEFSRDKKFIAYTLQDEDVVYVSKMQGRNVLYNEPVYHGILPLNIKWSPDNTSLFIQGPKIYTNPKIIQNDDPTTGEPAFIIELE
ncbi:WD40 repeat domain-containing protein [Paenibacillus polymyxa]|uniref:WD40 repeat domain-containing protein n=1 Tax=Paenibacillus polymyxa TaxID=1406 RepID=UPI001BE74990|nr:WD40 repeat domain-containing protein [Paenibacillus polymyxa]MBT2286754.1 WD40 repeat domain-containing protein [Paenibacillus polymyxa]